MPIASVKLDSRTFQALDDAAARRDMSRSDALREALLTWLGAPEPTRAWHQGRTRAYAATMRKLARAFAVAPGEEPGSPGA